MLHDLSGCANNVFVCVCISIDEELGSMPTEEAVKLLLGLPNTSVGWPSFSVGMQGNITTDTGTSTGTDTDTVNVRAFVNRVSASVLERWCM